MSIVRTLKAFYKNSLTLMVKEITQRSGPTKTQL